MPLPLRLALVGDYRSEAVAHQAIPLALARAADSLAIDIDPQWVPTPELGDLSAIRQSDAVWLVPGSPYKNDEGVYSMLRSMRESGKPFLGSCGGFQYAVIDYARNVLGWHDANHAETHDEGRMVIAPLSCWWNSAVRSLLHLIRVLPGPTGNYPVTKDITVTLALTRHSSRRWKAETCGLRPGIWTVMCAA